MKKINKLDYNQLVERAYHRIVSYAFSLISQLEDECLRQALVKVVEPTPTGGLLHEWVNPLLFLRLGCIDKEYVIHFGFEQADDNVAHANLTAAFMRYIYSTTARSRTAINIEGAVRTNWMISNPREMFDYLLDHGKHHALVFINPNVRKGKRILSVA